MNNTIRSLLFGLIFLINLSACCTLNSTQGFDFYDSAGNKYNSKSLKSDFSKVYPANFSPNIVLILTPSIDNEKYNEQMNNLNNIKDLEEKSIIFVTASLDQKYSSGYHTDKKTTLSLFENKPRDFRIILVSDKGQFISETSEPLSSLEIEKIFPIRG
jgi:hypothetical protein